MTTVFHKIAAEMLERTGDGRTWHVAAVMFPLEPAEADGRSQPDYTNIHLLSSFANDPDQLAHCAEIMHVASMQLVVDRLLSNEPDAAFVVVGVRDDEGQALGEANKEQSCDD